MARNQNQAVEMENETVESTEPQSVFPSVSVADKFSVMDMSGSTLAEVFAVAHDAFGIGHQTNYCVPRAYEYHEGDPMTAQQAREFSESRFRASLKNAPYPSVDHAATVPLKDLPRKWSLLEDAIDELVKRELPKQGVLPGTRDDRAHHVAEYLGAKKGSKFPSDRMLIRDAIRDELRSMILRPKKPNNSGESVETQVANGSAIIDEDDE